MTEPSQSPNPEPVKAAVPKILWLVVALVPAMLIATQVSGGLNGSDNSTADQLVGFGLNPLLAFAGSFGLLNKPGRNKVAVIVGAILLGAVFAFLNILIGLFAGCAMSGKGGRISP